MAKLSADQLRQEVRKLLTKMQEKGLIKTNNMNELVEDMAKTLEAVHPNQEVPQKLFTDSVQLTKLMLLAVGMMVGKTMEHSNLYKPGVREIFEPTKLALSMFAPEHNPELAQKQIALFMLALVPPPPGQIKKYEDLAELMVKQQQTFDTRDHQGNLDEEFETQMKRALAEYSYMLEECNETQAFGATKDGTPVYQAGPQRGNFFAAADLFTGKTDSKGFFYMDNSMNSQSESTKESIDERMHAMGEITSVSTAPTCKPTGSA